MGSRAALVCVAIIASSACAVARERPHEDRAAARAWVDGATRELCDLAIACEPRLGRFVLGSIAVCHPGLEDWFGWRNALAALERVETAFDAERAARCLEVIRRGECTDETDASFDCDLVFRSAAPVGTQCDVAWTMSGYERDHCAPELYCDEETCACAPRHAVGASCEGARECIYDAWCLRTEDGVDTCVEYGASPCRGVLDCPPSLGCDAGECVPPYATDGEPCHGDDGWPRSCAEGFFCSSEGGVSQCRALREEGETCRASSRECQEGLVCVASCVQPVEAGGRCSESADCAAAAPHCVEQADGGWWRCNASPLGRICGGGSGNLLANSPDCPGGLACVAWPHATDGLSWSGTCREPLALGDACEIEDVRCPSASRCVDGRCVRMVNPDDACGPDAVCPRTHTCTGDRCVPRPLLGEPCDAARPCIQGICADGECVWAGLEDCDALDSQCNPLPTSCDGGGS